MDTGCQGRHTETETETAGRVNLLKLNPLQLCVTSFIGVKTEELAPSACVCVCSSLCVRVSCVHRVCVACCRDSKGPLIKFI